MTPYQIEGMFRIRTEITIFQLKNKLGVMAALNNVGVYLKHTI